MTTTHRYKLKGLTNYILLGYGIESFVILLLKPKLNFELILKFRYQKIINKCILLFSTKQHVKAYIYCFFNFSQQFGSVLGRNKQLHEMFTIRSSNVQDARTSFLFESVRKSQGIMIENLKYSVYNKLHAQRKSINILCTSIEIYLKYFYFDVESMWNISRPIET